MTTHHIAENDPLITAQWVNIPRDGGVMRAYYAAPHTIGAGTPSIVMAMHIWGVDSDMRDIARGFASAGFATVIPELYGRFDAPNGDGATDYSEFAPFAQKLTADTVDPDIRAAAKWVKTLLPQSKTAIAGFCMGGVIALRRTVGYSDIFTAAAVWYGDVTKVDPLHVDIPIVGSYGANDSGIPPERVETFRKGLRVPNDIVVYPDAEHAFFDRERQSYQPAAADDSWLRAIAFLRARLNP
ncbi:MAG: dienelactone hydrolase family protein [Vulcanimicrobiaceae bacterium]